MSTGNVIGGHKVSSSLRPAVVVLRLNGDWDLKPRPPSPTRTLPKPQRSTPVRSFRSRKIRAQRRTPFPPTWTMTRRRLPGPTPRARLVMPTTSKLSPTLPRRLFSTTPLGGRTLTEFLVVSKRPCTVSAIVVYLPPPSSSVIAVLMFPFAFDRPQHQSGSEGPC